VAVCWSAGSSLLQAAAGIADQSRWLLGRRSCGANSFGLWEPRLLGRFSALPLGLICRQSRAMVHRDRRDIMGPCSQSLQLFRFLICSFLNGILP